MKKPLLFILVLMMLALVAYGQSENSLTVVMENFKSDQGKVRIGLYADSNSWLKKPLMGAVTEINNKAAVCTFRNIPAGVYAVSIIHDENSNEKLDIGYFGIPKEPYASSMGAKASFGPPKWEDAKFTMDGSDKEIVIKF